MACVFLTAFFMIVLVNILVDYIVYIYDFIGSYRNTKGSSVNSLIS